MWQHSHCLYCDSTKKSMTNIIWSLIILYMLPMYCLYIILYAGIINLIIFLKPGLEPRLWAFSCCKPSPSPIQARRWAWLGQAWVGIGPGPAHHYLYPLNANSFVKHINLANHQCIKIGRKTNAHTIPAENNGYFDSKVLSRQHAEVGEENTKVHWYATTLLP